MGVVPIPRTKPPKVASTTILPSDGFLLMVAPLTRYHTPSVQRPQPSGPGRTHAGAAGLALRLVFHTSRLSLTGHREESRLGARSSMFGG